MPSPPVFCRLMSHMSVAPSRMLACYTPNNARLRLICLCTTHSLFTPTSQSTAFYRISYKSSNVLDAISVISKVYKVPSWYSSQPTKHILSIPRDWKVSFAYFMTLPELVMSFHLDLRCTGICESRLSVFPWGYLPHVRLNLHLERPDYYLLNPDSRLT